MALPLITVVEIVFNGQIKEVQFADGTFFSKEALISSSELYVDKHDEADNFYSTDPVDMIKEVGELSMRFLREEPQLDDE